MFTSTAEKHKKNEDGELILPNRHFTRNSWSTFSLWAMPTAGDIIMAKQRSKKGKKGKPTRPCGVWFPVALFWAMFTEQMVEGPDSSRDKHIFSVSFLPICPHDYADAVIWSQTDPRRYFLYYGLHRFFASHIHFAIISWLFAIHQALCIITHPSCATASRGKQKSVAVSDASQWPLLIWNLLGLLPRYLWRAGRTLEPTGKLVLQWLLIYKVKKSSWISGLMLFSSTSLAPPLLHWSAAKSLSVFSEPSFHVKVTDIPYGGFVRI